VAGCCECGDEASGSCATELVSSLVYILVHTTLVCRFSCRYYKLLLVTSYCCSACLLYVTPVDYFYFFFSSVLLWIGIYRVPGRDVCDCCVIVAVGHVVSRIITCN
jgi:hypothetical protein